MMVRSSTHARLDNVVSGKYDRSLLGTLTCDQCTPEGLVKTAELHREGPSTSHRATSPA